MEEGGFMAGEIVYQTDELITGRIVTEGEEVEQLIVSNLRYTILPTMFQPRSQGLSSYRLLAPGGGKVRDPSGTRLRMFLRFTP